MKQEGGAAAAWAQAVGACAGRIDPVKLRYLEALIGRFEAASPTVRQVLEAKIRRELAALNASAVSEASPPNAVPGSRKAVPPVDVARRPPGLLAQLNQEIERTTLSAIAAAGFAGEAPGRPALRSALRFRETWARLSAETVLERAVHRAPENAGPLNAHNLVLRTLAQMRELSPDYLRRFMTHTESLMWLDQAFGQLKASGAKGKGTRSSRTTR